MEEFVLNLSIHFRYIQPCDEKEREKEDEHTFKGIPDTVNIQYLCHYFTKQYNFNWLITMGAELTRPRCMRLNTIQRPSGTNWRTGEAITQKSVYFHIKITLALTLNQTLSTLH